jgi:hypothetical protein
MMLLGAAVYVGLAVLGGLLLASLQVV